MKIAPKINAKQHVDGKTGNVKVVDLIRQLIKFSSELWFQ